MDRPDETVNCTLLRRCFIIIYDGILLACIVFIAWQPVPLLPESLNPYLDRSMRLGYLLIICFGYFGWCWCRGGQTLGMRAWKIRLVPINPEQDTVHLRQAWIRFLASLLSWAMLGAGFLLALFHSQRFSLHDILSGTKLVRIRPD